MSRENTAGKHLVIVADYREKNWDEHVKNDPRKTRLPENVLLSMELKIDRRFMDIIDLVNYAATPQFLENPSRALIDRDETVTLNGIFLADYLQGRGYTVDLIRNGVAEAGDLADLLRQEPLAVIISTTFFTFAALREIFSAVKKWLTRRTRVIIGGPAIYYAARFYPEILQLYGPMLAGSFLVKEKQGERSLVQLLERLGPDGDDPAAVMPGLKNVIYIDDWGKLTVSPSLEENNGIEDHTIDWSGLPDRFLAPVTPFRTSLGCPFRCDFCTFWVLHPKPSYKSISTISRELKQIDRRQPVRHLMIIDDTLNISEERINGICRAFIDQGLSLSWSAFFRSKPVTREMARLLKEANCQFVHIGFESFDDHILQNMNKRETVADHLRGIGFLKEAGLGVLGSFIFGYPGESEATITRAVPLINGSGIDVSEIYGFIFYPYSPLAQKREQFKLTGDIHDWSHYSMNSQQLYETLLPQVVGNLDSFGLLDWDNWGSVALLCAYGFTMPEITEMFRIKQVLLRYRQHAGSDIDFKARLGQELARLNAILKKLPKNQLPPGGANV